MDLPCLETFGPSRLPWPGRIGTTAAADFCAHESGYPGRPAFRASPTHGYASQISPNKSVNFRCTSSPSTLESVGNGFAVHGQLTSGSLWASMAFLFVASQLWRDAAGCYADRAPQASFPQSVALPQLPSPRTSVAGLHLVSCPPDNSRFVQGTFTPQVHAHVGRTDAREAAAPSELKSTSHAPPA
jgi:hypothetical protein